MTELNKHVRLFDLIAPVYNLFFQAQVKSCFNFIYQGYREVSGIFPRVDVIDVAPQRALYLCTP